jgi:hypothetical protein
MGELVSDPVPVHDLDYFHGLTAPHDRYTQHGKEVAWSILRSGFVEECIEVVFGTKDLELGRTTWKQPAGKHKLAPEEHFDKEGEIGDGLYYVSEMSRFGRADPDEVLRRYDSFEALQAANPGLALPIYDHDRRELTLADDDRAVLGVTVMRAIDVINPKTDALWLGHSGRPSLGRALGDVVSAFAYYAGRYDITLVTGLHHTIDKLEGRKRSPDVVAQADQNSHQPISSRRDRLNVIPWISELVNNAGVNQWTPRGAEHPDRVIT